MSTRGNSANEVTCGSSKVLQGWCICQCRVESDALLFTGKIHLQHGLSDE